MFKSIICAVCVVTFGIVNGYSPVHAVETTTQPPIVEATTQQEQQIPIQGIPLQVEPAPLTLQEQQSIIHPLFIPGSIKIEKPRQPDHNFGDILTPVILEPFYRQR